MKKYGKCFECLQINFDGAVWCFYFAVTQFWQSLYLSHAQGFTRRISLLTSWDSYKEEIKCGFGREPWHHCNFSPSIFLLVRLKESYIPKHSLFVGV